MKWVQYNKTVREFREAGLNVPGTLVEVLDHSEQFLIGDCTNRFATRGEFPAVSLQDIVVRYKVVWKAASKCSICSSQIDTTLFYNDENIDGVVYCTECILRKMGLIR